MSLLPSRSKAEPPEDAEPRVVGVDSEDADEVLSALSSGTARSLLAAIHEEPAPPSELSERVDTSLQNAQYHLEKLENAGAVTVVDTAYSAKGREMDVYAPADQPLVIFAGDEEDGSMLRDALSRLLGAVGVLGLASLVIQQLYGEPLLGGDGGGVPGGQSAATGGQDGGMAAGDAASGAGSPTPTPTGTHGTTTATHSTASGGNGGASVLDTTNHTAKGTAHTMTDTAEHVTNATASAARTATETAMHATETATRTAAGTATQAPDAIREASAGLPPGLVFFAGGLFALAVVAAVVSLR